MMALWPICRSPPPGRTWPRPPPRSRSGRRPPASPADCGRGRAGRARARADCAPACCSRADQLRSLQAHHPIRLGPASVIADAHAHDAVEGAPHREAQVAHVEIALLEMLEGAVGLVLRVPREVDLSILADERSPAVHQDGRVVAPGPARFLRRARRSRDRSRCRAAGPHRRAGASPGRASRARRRRRSPPGPPSTSGGRRW